MNAWDVRKADCGMNEQNESITLCFLCVTDRIFVYYVDEVPALSSDGGGHYGERTCSIPVQST
jgi:hypothetical protein